MSCALPGRWGALTSGQATKFSGSSRGWPRTKKRSALNALPARPAAAAMARCLTRPPLYFLLKISLAPQPCSCAFPSISRICSSPCAGPRLTGGPTCRPACLRPLQGRGPGRRCRGLRFLRAGLRRRRCARRCPLPSAPCRAHPYADTGGPAGTDASGCHVPQARRAGGGCRGGGGHDGACPRLRPPYHAGARALL